MRAPNSMIHQFLALSGQVFPDLGAVASAETLRHIVGALLTFGLLTALLTLISCSAAWSIATAAGSWDGAAKAKRGLLVGLGGTAVLGAAIPLANWLLDLGSRL